MKSSNNTKTILVMVVGFLILSYVFRSNETASSVLFFLAIGVGLIELISPKLGNYIVLAWNKLAHILGWINTRIILTLVFYLFLFPLAFLYKLIGKDPLQRKDPKQSVFKVRNHTYAKADLENIW